nr:hypothetical protein [Tanacetum cinerariifolium]
MVMMHQRDMGYYLLRNQEYIVTRWIIKRHKPLLDGSSSCSSRHRAGKDVGGKQIISGQYQLWRDMQLKEQNLSLCSISQQLRLCVVSISYATTNKAFYVSKDPSGIESSFNGMYKFLAPCHILISLKPHIHTRVEPIDLVFLNFEIQCFHNVHQCTITEFVNLIEPHDLPFIVTEEEHNYTSNVLVTVEFLTIKPPIRYIIRGTDVVGADLIDPHMLRNERILNSIRHSKYEEET